jgi:hypothetical protein
LDAKLFGDPRADKYLRNTSSWLIEEWQKRGKLPALISKDGRDLAKYESPEMLAGVMPALQNLRPAVASAIEGRLQANFRDGIWFDQQSFKTGFGLEQRFKTTTLSHSSNHVVF